MTKVRSMLARGGGVFGILVASMGAAAFAASQGSSWERYENAAMNISFQVPGGWSTTAGSEDGVPMLTSLSPDESISLVVVAYKDEAIGTEELLDRAIEELDAELEGEAEELDINGLHAWMATGVGVIDGGDVGLVIMAATYDENNYVAYVFSDIDVFERNAELMGTIIGTFAPLRTGAALAPGAVEGGFIVVPPVQLGAYAAIYEELEQASLLQTIADDLNGSLALPTTVALGFDACGAVNAFYDPSTRKITFCFELMEHLAGRFRSDTADEAEMVDALAGATVFVLFHEVGHALVDVLQLPITGREEDAVDQLATYVLTDGTDEGEQAALDGARWFYLEDVSNEAAELAFWDEHSLNQQRFYNVLCWVFGQDEAKYASLVADGVLPSERAARCGAEYAQVSRAWETLLDPYLR